MSSRITEEDRVFSLIILKNKLATKVQVEKCLRELLETTERGLAFISVDVLLVDRVELDEVLYLADSGFGVFAFTEEAPIGRQ